MGRFPHTSIREGYVIIMIDEITTFKNASAATIDGDAIASSIRALVKKNVPVEVLANGTKLLSITYSKSWNEGTTSAEIETYIQDDDSLKQEIIGYKQNYTKVLLTPEEQQAINNYIAANYPQLSNDLP